MRPRLPDIAAPPLRSGTAWLKTERPPRMEHLTAGAPVLVHFFDFAQLNSVRALPYIRAWHERYAPAGLAVLGVHSPRYPFSAEKAAVQTACERLRIDHPVAVDSGHGMWRDYGCEGWPSLFLWGRGGTLRWFHFGEGEYRETEEAIQELLRESNPAAQLPEPLAPLRETDAPGALVVPPTEEVFPGGAASRPWRAGEDRPSLELDYSAGGAYASADGDGEIEVAIDRRAMEPVLVDAPGLYELAAHDRHEEHRLAIRPSPRLRVWSLSFAPGLP